MYMLSKCAECPDYESTFTTDLISNCEICIRAEDRQVFKYVSNQKTWSRLALVDPRQTGENKFPVVAVCETTTAKVKNLDPGKQYLVVEPYKKYFKFGSTMSCQPLFFENDPYVIRPEEDEDEDEEEEEDWEEPLVEITTTVLCPPDWIEIPIRVERVTKKYMNGIPDYKYTFVKVLTPAEVNSHSYFWQWCNPEFSRFVYERILKAWLTHEYEDHETKYDDDTKMENYHRLADFV